VHHGSGYLRAPCGDCLVENDDVDGNPDVAQSTPQADRFSDPIVYGSLDYEEVQVTA
jgi:hypothetical protein